MEGMMRRMFLSALAAIAVIAAPTIAEANTCAAAAQICKQKGGSHNSCFDAERMKQCKASRIYTAPNGNTYPVSG